MHVILMSIFRFPCHNSDRIHLKTGNHNYVTSIIFYNFYRYQCGELGWFDSGYELLESPCECGIEPPGPITHGVAGSIREVAALYGFPLLPSTSPNPMRHPLVAFWSRSFPWCRHTRILSACQVSYLQIVSITIFCLDRHFSSIL